MPANIPFDILGEIVDTLGADPETLQELGFASRELNTLTRPILFWRVHIGSIPRLLQLSSLILTSFVTIPERVADFCIRIELLKRTDAHFPMSDVREALAIVLHHFDFIGVSTTLNLPWSLSRMVDWEYIRQSPRTIQKLTLSGTHSSPSDLVMALSHMTSLNSLLVDASWNSSKVLWDSLPNQAALPSTLKEICCSANSLDLLRWACSLPQQTRPRDLCIVRAKIDGRNSEFASHFLPLFLEKYGQNLKNLHLWFEEIPFGSSVYRGA
jgi:hypothetical protein